MGIPSYIIDMPTDFLGTPLGQALRPMFEQARGRHNAAVGTQHTHREAFSL